MKIKITTLFTVFLLLSFFATEATACPPPYCGNCYWWHNGGCECKPAHCCSDSDCSPCFYGCEDCACQPCKCWDTGDPIVEDGGLFVDEHVTLCNEAHFYADYDDYDHWTSGAGSSEDSPRDFIWSQWSKIPLSNPEAGEWKGAEDLMNIIWQAPPCIGTVRIKDVVDDVPDEMDLTCPGTGNTRDDDSISSDEKITTVVLPAGCSECGTTPSVTPTANPQNGCSYCGSAYGVTVPGNAASHTYSLNTPCYDDCKWHPQLGSVDTTVKICSSCPSNPPTVACLTDVAGMTQAQACAHKAKFADPMTYNDIKTSIWCRDCVAKHEEEHMEKDWVEDALSPQITNFKNYLAANPIDIDCSVGSSVYCSTAITSAMSTQFYIKWLEFINAAFSAWNSEVSAPPVDCTLDARAAEVACYQQILNALKAKCP